MCECGWERRVLGCGDEGVIRKEKLEATRRSLIVRGEDDTMPRCFPDLVTPKAQITGNSEHPGGRDVLQPFSTSTALAKGGKQWKTRSGYS
jgi:hypothetical protein